MTGGLLPGVAILTQEATWPALFSRVCVPGVGSNTEKTDGAEQVRDVSRTGTYKRGSWHEQRSS